MREVKSVDLTSNPKLVYTKKDVFEAKIEYLNESLNTINLTYGSLDNFIINVLKADAKKLKEKFLH